MTKNNLNIKRSNFTKSIFIDSEWSSSNSLISLQILSDETIYFYYDSKFEYLEKAVQKYQLSSHFTEFQDSSIQFIPLNSLYSELNKDQIIFKDFFNRKFPKCKNIQTNKTNERNKRNETILVHFFYSIRDLTYLFGEDILKNCISARPAKTAKNRSNYIFQKNKIEGRFEYEIEENINENTKATIILKDKFGWANKGGLKGLVSTLGINSKYKDECNVYKACMEYSLTNLELATKFLNYSINDVVVLSEIDLKMPKFLNQVALGINLLKGNEGNEEEKQSFFTPENTPGSIGSIVERIVAKFIHNSFFNFFNFESQNLLKQFEIENQRWSVEKLYRSSSFSLSKKKKKADSVSSLISGGSIKSFFYLHQGNSGVLNVLVHGGRTYNERWENFYAKNVFDLDFSGCYGNALKEFTVPIGLPTVVAYTSTQEHLTLKEFLNYYENELVDNLYTITISGRLGYKQTLLYSKFITA